MNWESNEPHTSKFKSKTLEKDEPGKTQRLGMGDHNYCREPKEKEAGAWCYTMNPEKKWDYCKCGPSDGKTTKGPNPTTKTPFLENNFRSVSCGGLHKLI